MAKQESEKSIPDMLAQERANERRLESSHPHEKISGKGFFDRVTATDHGVTDLEGAALLATANFSGSNKVRGYVQEGHALNHGTLFLEGNGDRVNAYMSGKVKVSKVSPSDAERDKKTGPAGGKSKKEKKKDKEKEFGGSVREVTASSRGEVDIDVDAQRVIANSGSSIRIGRNAAEVRSSGGSHVEVGGNVTEEAFADDGDITILGQLLGRRHISGHGRIFTPNRMKTPGRSVNEGKKLVSSLGKNHRNALQGI